MVDNNAKVMTTVTPAAAISTTIALFGELFFTIARLTNYHIAYFSSISVVIIIPKRSHPYSAFLETKSIVIHTQRTIVSNPSKAVGFHASTESTIGTIELLAKNDRFSTLTTYQNDRLKTNYFC